MVADMVQILVGSDDIAIIIISPDIPIYGTL